MEGVVGGEEGAGHPVVMMLHFPHRPGVVQSAVLAICGQGGGAVSKIPKQNNKYSCIK